MTKLEPQVEASHNGLTYKRFDSLDERVQEVHSHLSQLVMLASALRDNFDEPALDEVRENVLAH